MEEKIKRAFSHIFYSCDMNDDDAKELNNLEQELLKEAKNQALIIASVSHRRELLMTVKKRFDEAMNEPDLIVQQSMFYDLFNGINCG